MATLSNLVVNLSLKDGLSKELSGVAGKLNGLASNFRKVGAGLTAGVTLPVVAMGAQIISAASDLNEAQSAVNTVFGDSASVINDYAKTSATAMGVSQQAYLDASSGLGALFTGIGLTQKTSADFSTNILQNASDLASFYNTDPGTALQDLQSGLVGEAEPLRKYGILLSEAAVQQKAMEQTGKDNAKQLTESEKVTARYALIQEQLGAAQGDFARTSGGLANTQRILKAQLADTAAQMGQVLLPYVLQAANALKGLLQWVQNLSPRLQKIIVIAGLLAAALGPVLLIIGTLIPAITALGGAFALLLGPVGLVIAAIALLSAAYIGNWFGFADAVNAVVKAFKNLLKTKTVLTFLNGLEKAIMRPIQALKKMAQALGGIGKAILSGDFRGALQQGQKFLAGFGDYLASPAKAIGQLLKGINTGFKPLDDVLHTAGKLFVDFGRLVQEVFQGDLSGALDVAGRMFGHLGELGQQAWDLLKAGFDAIDWGAVASTALSALASVGRALLNGVLAGWDAIKPKLTEYATGLAGWVLDQITDAPDKLKTVGEALLNGVIAGWDAIKPTLAGYASGLGSWVLGQITDAANALKGVGSDLIQGILNGWDEAGAKLDAYASGLTTWVFAKITDVGTALLGVGTGLIQGVLDGWDSLKGSLSSYASGLPGWVFDQITGASTALTSIGSDLVQGIIDGITAMAGQIKDAIIGPVTDAINAAIDIANKVPGVNIGKIGGGGSGGIGGSGTGAATASPSSGYGSNPGETGEINPQQAANDAGVTPIPLFNMIQKQAQTLSDKLKTMPNIGTPLTVAAPDIAAFTTAMNTIGTLTGTMVGNVAALIGQNTRNIGQAMSDALSAASTYSNAIYSVVSANIGSLVGNTSALMGAFRNAVGQGFSGALSAAATYSAAIVSVTQSAFGQIPGIVAGALSSAASTAYSYGANIGQSLAAGMASALGQIQATAAQMAAAAEAGVAARARIASPSKVFIGLGQSIGDGFALGIEDRYAAATRAGNGLAASAIPGIGGAGGAAMGRGTGFTNYGTIRVEAPSPEDFYAQWRQQQMGGVRR